MLVFCILVLIAGLVLGVFAPVFEFVIGLSVVALMGSAAALWSGTALVTALLYAAAFFGIAQVGYVLGVGVIAMSGMKAVTNWGRRQDVDADARLPSSGRNEHSIGSQKVR